VLASIITATIAPNFRRTRPARRARMYKSRQCRRRASWQSSQDSGVSTRGSRQLAGQLSSPCHRRHVIRVGEKLLNMESLTPAGTSSGQWRRRTKPAASCVTLTAFTSAEISFPELACLVQPILRARAVNAGDPQPASRIRRSSARDGGLVADQHLKGEPRGHIMPNILSSVLSVASVQWRERRVRRPLRPFVGAAISAAVDGMAFRLFHRQPVSRACEESTWQCARRSCPGTNRL